MVSRGSWADSGLECILELTRSQHTAQTDVQAIGSPSADDFLAREQALLGDDAAQFATSGDAAAFADTPGGDDDLLGGGGAETAQFQSQFPDLNTGNEVNTRPAWPPLRDNLLTHKCSRSPPAAPSPPPR